jgi:hypothetical protein
MQQSTPHQTTRMIWIALLFSQAVYIAVAFLRPGLVGTSFADNRIFSAALALVAVITAGMAHMFWRRASGQGLPFHEARGHDPAQSIPLFILAWVLDESIAIYGLVQALMGIPPEIWLLFSLAGAVLLIMHRPVEPTA